MQENPLPLTIYEGHFESLFTQNMNFSPDAVNANPTTIQTDASSSQNTTSVLKHIFARNTE